MTHLRSTAALTAEGVTAAVVLCVAAALWYDLAVWPDGLVPVFLLGSTPLLLAGLLDIAIRRRLARSDAAAELEAVRLSLVGLPLLAFGGLFTVIEVGVGGVKDTDVARWTSGAVGYLLASALLLQSLLVALTWALRRRSLHRPGRHAAPA